MLLSFEAVVGAYLRSFPFYMRLDQHSNSLLLRLVFSGDQQRPDTLQLGLQSQGQHFVCLI